MESPCECDIDPPDFISNEVSKTGCPPTWKNRKMPGNLVNDRKQGIVREFPEKPRNVREPLIRYTCTVMDKNTGSTLLVPSRAHGNVLNLREGQGSMINSQVFDCFQVLDYFFLLYDAY